MEKKNVREVANTDYVGNLTQVLYGELELGEVPEKLPRFFEKYDESEFDVSEEDGELVEKADGLVDKINELIKNWDARGVQLLLINQYAVGVASVYGGEELVSRTKEYAGEVTKEYLGSA